MVELEKSKAIESTEKILEGNPSAANAIIETVAEALNRVGQLYQEEEYYLAELVYAGDVAKTILGLIEPHLIIEDTSEKDMAKKIIIGTVQGDLHEIGKNIVNIFAKGAGYEVVDLGSDVPEEAFIENLKKHDAKILGLSCLLTACDKELNKILAALKSEGLVDTKVVIGGAAMTEKLANDLEKETGIKTKFAPDAITGIQIFNELID